MARKPEFVVKSYPRPDVASVPARDRPSEFAAASLGLLLALTFLIPGAVAQPAIKTGPETGTVVPSFQAPDQNGRMRKLKSIMGPKGALLVFFRSADW